MATDYGKFDHLEDSDEDMPQAPPRTVRATPETAPPAPPADAPPEPPADAPPAHKELKKAAAKKKRSRLQRALAASIAFSGADTPSSPCSAKTGSTAPSTAGASTQTQWQTCQSSFS